MLRSIGKQSGESVESVLKKKMKAVVGAICREGRFCAWTERVSLSCLQCVDAVGWAAGMASGL